MRVRLEKDGATISLDGPPMARGGEAAILPVPDRPGLLAKVYHKPTPEQADKLAVMIAAPPDDPTARQGHTSIAWPVERLFLADAPSRCVGFVMPRVEKSRPLFDAYNPKSRLEAWPLFHYGYLLRTARNLSAAVRALHTAGYVLGDLNESNVLVNGQTLVTLVDTDSFQVRAAGRLFRCGVGKPEYAAPEIQGADLASTDRNPEQDSFALAVLIFQLLMQGTHPFAGRFTGEGEPAILGKRIAAGFWPYSRERRGLYEPIPTAPPITVLPFPVRELMRQCFEDGHDRPQARPGPGDWYTVLTEADGQLVECVENPQHRFHKSIDVCPWCEQAARMGRDPFLMKEQLLSGVEKTESRVAAPFPGSGAASARRSSTGELTPRRSPRPFALPAVLRTPWPYLIGLGVVALAVLIDLTVSNARRPSVSPGAGVLYAGAVPPGPAKKSDEKQLETAAKPPSERPPAAEPIGEVRRFNEHANHLTGVALSGDGARALSGDWDGVLRWWDVRTAKELGHISTGSDVVLGVAISPDGRRALSCGWGKDVHLWDLDSAKEVQAFRGHLDYVRCVAFSPDGRRALSGGEDRTMRLWDVQTGKLLRIFSDHAGWVTAVAFSPDGGRVASACADHGVRIWDLDGGGEPLEYTDSLGPVQCVAFGRDGNAVACAGDDGGVRLWNTATGLTLAAMTGHDGPVRSVAFTPDGRRVLSGGDDGTLRLWDAATGKELHCFRGHDGAVREAACCADGVHAVSAGDDWTARVWNMGDR